MRVLHISSSRTYSGTERHIGDLCRGLAARGHEVHMALRPTNEWEGRLDFLDPERLMRTSIRNSFGMFNATRIGKYLKECRIDVIHAHVARDYIASAVAARISDTTRFVLTRHMMGPLKPFHRLALRNADAAIAVSPAVAGQLERTFARKKIHLILNGLRVELGNEEQTSGREFRDFHSIPHDIPLIGTLGELKPSKGQRDFILAAGEVIKEAPECRFVIAGIDHTVDQRFKRELKRLARVLGLSDKITWLEWLDETAPLFAAIDVFVSPSHSESFGLAILEAMARGKAVAASRTDGARELLGRAGSIFPVNAPVEMAAAIVDLIDDRDRRMSMGSELQKIASERFSVERMVDQTEALYRSLF